MILALDTSTRNTSVALGDARTVWQLSTSGGEGASATILEQLDHLFALSGQSRAALTCLACGAGPGSFTGLRVSCSIIRSLAMALSLPVVMVSSLDALAHPFAGVEELYIVQRARTGHAYFARYQRGVPQGETRFLTPAETTTALEAAASGPFIAGDAASGFAALPQGAVVLDATGAPAAGDLIRLALPLHERQEYTPFEKVLPAYMRPSDAEEKSGVL